MSTRSPAPRGGRGSDGSRPADRYGDDGTTRVAFVPGVLAAIAALVGVAFASDSGGATVVRYVVAILALIMIVFAVQARAFAWVVPLAVVAVVWNPVVALRLDGAWWAAAQLAAAVVLVAAGVAIKVPDGDR